MLPPFPITLFSIFNFKNRYTNFVILLGSCKFHAGPRLNFCSDQSELQENDDRCTGTNRIITRRVLGTSDGRQASRG